jgi:hypothetical protein
MGRYFSLGLGLGLIWHVCMSVGVLGGLYTDGIFWLLWVMDI